MMRYLLRELEMVRSHQEFAHASARVSKLFCELADLMIVAREYRYENPGQEPQEIDEKARALNRQLEKEIKRIRALAGGDHWLERCQEEAALRLAAFEARKASL